MYNHYFRWWITFWKSHPALFYSLAVVFGVQLGLAWQASLLVPALALLLPFLLTDNKSRAFLASSLIVVSYLYVHFYYQFPDLSKKQQVYGEGKFVISSIGSSSQRFGNFFIFRGTLVGFKGIDEEGSCVEANKVPCQIRLPVKKGVALPSGDYTYRIHGYLKDSKPMNYFLQTVIDKPWYGEKRNFSLVEFRYKAKNWLSAYIHQQVGEARSALFLSGIITGDFDDRMMQFEFSRFGLQHIMAISGFHFAILAAILSFFLRFFLNKKWSSGLLILLLSCYFLFLGIGPSIMRAWAAIVVFLMGHFFERESSGLNSLGVALMAVLFLEPLMSQNLGFQFSFLTTAAILVLFSPIEQRMRSFFLKRSLSKAIEMDRFNQHGVILASFLRSAFSLGLAVNLIALPVTLFYFHKFPWMSLAYNLFFPFMVSISMFLLIVALPLSGLVPFLGGWLFQLNGLYTQFMLNYAFNIPITFDFWLRSNSLSGDLLILYLTFVFTLGILMRKPVN